VARAAAFPVPDARLGEKLCLAVVRRAGAAFADEALLSHFDAAGLSRYDMPEFVLEVEALPMTASGKITKLGLVRGVRDGTLHPRPVRFTAVS
jgi:acyl-CoA synthetase